MNPQSSQIHLTTHETVITNQFSVLKYACFLGINIPLVLFPLIFIIILQKGDVLSMAFTFFAAVAIIFVQYPLLVLLKSWILKTIIFYLSMVLFFFVFGAVIGSGSPGGGYQAGTINSMFHSGIVMIFFGHLFGGVIIFPVIAMINWLLRKKTFVYSENK